MAFKLGIDIGGTFTDFALYDEETGRIGIHKQLTTPHEPSECVLDGTRTILAAQEVELAYIRAVVHGTTLVTNALIERKGSVIGMLTTAGFRHVLDIAESTRHDIYDWDIRLQQPLVPGDLLPAPMRFEVHERIDHRGTVQEALDVAEVRQGVETLLRRFNIESLAVCLLHSYQNASHEEQIKALLSEEYPDLYVSVSAEVFPFMREYERFHDDLHQCVRPAHGRSLPVAHRRGIGADGIRGKSL